MGDQTPYWILLIGIAVAAVAFIVGLNVLRARRHASDHQHLEADIAEPETLADLGGEPPR